MLGGEGSAYKLPAGWTVYYQWPEGNRDVRFLFKFTQHSGTWSSQGPTPNAADTSITISHSLCFQLENQKQRQFKKEKNKPWFFMTSWFYDNLHHFGWRSLPELPTLEAGLQCVGRQTQTRRATISSKFSQGLWNVNHLGNRLGWCHDVVINLFFFSLKCFT